MSNILSNFLSKILSKKFWAIVQFFIGEMSNTKRFFVQRIVQLIVQFFVPEFFKKYSLDVQ